MKKLLKNSLSILLTLAIMMSTAVFSFAEDGVKVIASGNCGKEKGNSEISAVVTYTLYENGELIISGTGKMWNYAWEDSPFYKNKDIKKVIIGKGVTSVGKNAFRLCSSLVSVTIPEGVTVIYDDAFQNCTSITEVSLPAGVEIKTSAFLGCKALKKLTVPGGGTDMLPL